MQMIRNKIVFLGLVLWCCAIGLKASTPDYWRSDSVKVMRLLKEAALQKAETNYMLFFARKLTGIPYVAKTLENNEQERLVVNLRQFDCTTFVETVLALKRCMDQRKPTFANFCDNLQLIRYRGGAVSYANRLHYFSAWIHDNEDLRVVTNIGRPNPPFAAVQHVKVNYMTTHVDRYPMLVKHRDWIPMIKQMEDSITGRSYRYIPKNMLSDSKLLRQTIHDGDIIVILTSKAGLDTSHIAIAVWHRDGLHMIDASSIYKRVIEEPKLMSRYMAEHPSHTGIRIVRPL